eukprot:9565182-Ditylum_brightwellii.AAC.1
MSMTADKFVGHITPKGADRDPSGLGIFKWHRFRGKGKATLRIVTFYKPCCPKGPGSAYTQHQVWFDKIGRVGCPRKALLDDIKEEMDEWRETGDQIILM